MLEGARGRGGDGATRFQPLLGGPLGGTEDGDSSLNLSTFLPYSDR